MKIQHAGWKPDVNKYIQGITTGKYASTSMHMLNKDAEQDNAYIYQRIDAKVKSAKEGRKAWYNTGAMPWFRGDLYNISTYVRRIRSGRSK